MVDWMTSHYSLCFVLRQPRGIRRIPMIFDFFVDVFIVFLVSIYFLALRKQQVLAVRRESNTSRFSLKPPLIENRSNTQSSVASDIQSVICCQKLLA